MQHPQQSRFSKLLSGAAVVAVASILLPTVKASPAVEVSTTASTQDPDELHKLRSEIQRLEKAHAELRRKLDSLGRRRGADKAEAEDEVETVDIEDDADAEEHEHGRIKVEGFALKPGQGGGHWITKDGKAFTVRSGSGEHGAIEVEGLPLKAGQAGGHWISKEGTPFALRSGSGEHGAIEVEGLPLKTGQAGGHWISKEGKPIRLHAAGDGVFVFGDDAKGEAKTFTIGKGKQGVYYLERKGGKAEVRHEGSADDDDDDGGHVIELQGEDGGKRVIRLRPTLKGEHLIIETEVEGDDAAQVEGDKGKAKGKAKKKAKNRIM